MADVQVEVNAIIDDGLREGLARAAEAIELLRAASIDDLRAGGWTVAVHNDYRLAGEPRTFWLLTHPDGCYAKGEGADDAEAIAEVRAAIGALERYSRYSVVYENGDSEPVREVAFSVEHAETVRTERNARGRGARIERSVSFQGPWREVQP